MSIWSLTYQQSVLKRYHIFQSYTYKMAAKINSRRYGTITTLLSPYVLYTHKTVIASWADTVAPFQRVHSNDDLNWLDVTDRVTYKLGVVMHRCRHGKAPQYLVDCCTPVTDVVGRQNLRSVTQQLMVVPRHRLTTVGRRAFAVHGPMVWNSLPDDLRAQQDYESFRQGLKAWLFSRY